MKRSARSREILSLLRERQELTVEEACEIFKISQATVRRDFATLAENGEAEKTWGGLRHLDPRTNPMLPAGLRENIWLEEKRLIAKRAATFCQDGDIIFIDGGTTTLQLAPWIAGRSVRVVTNSLLVAHEIDRLRTGPKGAEVFLTGGYLYPSSGLLVGPDAVEGLRRYRATTSFLSVGGITEEGIFNNHHLVVETERVMISRSERVVFLADHSKFGRHELVPESSWKELNFIVTDQHPAPAFEKLAGDRIIVAPPEGL
jgi:DeoR/GlpR family transcriptional regulator of sugar metabolism